MDIDPPLPESLGSARQIAASVRSGKRSAGEIAEHYLKVAAAREPAIGAFLHLDPEDVRGRAEAIDQQLRSGTPGGPLAGVPVAVKDNLCTRGLPTTCGSKVLEGFVPLHDATVVERLEAAGALVFGKTNLDEFAMGASTENSGYQPTRNPRALDCVPGGSSGGSAAAVAAGMTPLALGSDTGGSVRQPASFCGVVGLRPTYGLVSRHGLVAFASSLDQVGPFAADAEDAELLLRVIAGPDPRDSTCRREDVDSLFAPVGQGRPLRVGLPREYGRGGVDPEVAEALERSRAALEEDGAECVPVSLPLTDHAIATYYLIVTSEASSNLARYDGVRYGPRSPASDLAEMYARTRGGGFGEEVKRRILLGTFALSAGYFDEYYKKALQVRQLIRLEFEAAFAEVDFLLGPTAPTAAFKLGEKVRDPLELYLCDVFTAPSALAGLPGVSVPVGRTGDGRPIGAQILGPPRSDVGALRLAGRLAELLGEDGRSEELPGGI